MCDNIQDNYNKEKIMLNNVFLHKKVIDDFHNKSYIPTIEKLSFHLARVRILGSMECGKTRIVFVIIHKNIYKVKEISCRKIKKTTGIEIQIQY